jgi:hypothetical protein
MDAPSSLRPGNMVQSAMKFHILPNRQIPVHAHLLQNNPNATPHG